MLEAPWALKTQRDLQRTGSLLWLWCKILGFSTENHISVLRYYEKGDWKVFAADQESSLSLQLPNRWHHQVVLRSPQASAEHRSPQRSRIWRVHNHLDFSRVGEPGQLDGWRCHQGSSECRHGWCPMVLIPAKGRPARATHAQRIPEALWKDHSQVLEVGLASIWNIFQHLHRWGPDLLVPAAQEERDWIQQAKVNDEK